MSQLKRLTNQTTASATGPPYGIEILAEGKDVRAEYVMLVSLILSSFNMTSIVFVHGLGGHKTGTWTTDGKLITHSSAFGFIAVVNRYGESPVAKGASGRQPQGRQNYRLGLRRGSHC